jgi:hypothetical protein
VCDLLVGPLAQIRLNFANGDHVGSVRWLCVHRQRAITGPRDVLSQFLLVASENVNAFLAA